MKHEELEIGNIVSVSLTYGATTVENQEFVEVEFGVVKVVDIHPHKPLIKISYSPEVWVLDEAIQGIPISELVIKVSIRSRTYCTVCQNITKKPEG